jgi:hypothetical protein
VRRGDLGGEFDGARSCPLRGVRPVSDVTSGRSPVERPPSKAPDGRSAPAPRIVHTSPLSIGHIIAQLNELHDLIAGNPAERRK